MQCVITRNVWSPHATRNVDTSCRLCSSFRFSSNLLRHMPNLVWSDLILCRNAWCGMYVCMWVLGHAFSCEWTRLVRRGSCRTCGTGRCLPPCQYMCQDHESCVADRHYLRRRSSPYTSVTSFKQSRWSLDILMTGPLIVTQQIPFHILSVHCLLTSDTWTSTLTTGSCA